MDRIMPRISRWARTVGMALALWGLPVAVVGQSASDEPGKSATADDGGWTTQVSPATPSDGATPDGRQPASTPEQGKQKTTEAASAAQARRKESSAPRGGEELDGATYQVRLRDLEQRVDELKEQIRRSHTRLSLLSDTLLSGGGGGARAEIVFENHLSGIYKLIGAVVVLDGAVQYRKQDETGALGGQPTIPIFSGSIPPGEHTLQVRITIRGHGYGVFSYTRGYQFDVTGSYSFTVTDGKAIDVRVVGWERGGATTPFEKRPALRFGAQLRNLGDAPAIPLDRGDGSEGAGRVDKSISVGGEGR